MPAIGERLGFDGVLEQVGSWGHYQKRLWFLTTVALELFTCCNQIIMMFAGAAPRFLCADQLAAIEQAANVTETPADSFTNNCSQLMTCETLQFAEQVVTIATDFRLYCDRSAISEILTSLQMGGVLMGAFFWGQMAEIFGRKKILIASFASFMMSGLAASISQSWQLLAVMMFLMGTSAGGFYCVVFVLVQEIIATSKRIFCSTINGWTMGMFVFAAEAWYFRNWRHMLMFNNGVGALLGLLVFFFVEESPRWLIQHRRWEQAERTLERIAALNGRHAPGVEQLRVQATGERHKKYSYRHLFRTRRLTVYTLTLAVSWFVVSCVSYALAFNVKNLPGDRYTNILLVAITGGLSSWSINLWNICCGRRTLHQVSLLSVVLCLIVVIAVELFGSALGSIQGTIVTVFAILGGASTSPTWNMVYLYTAELFPTVVRPLSNALSSIFARVGGIIAPLLLLTSSYWLPLPYLIFATLCGVNVALVAFLLPETRGEPLPDVLPDSDRKARRLLADSSGAAILL